jgi:hypothetical protein
VCQKPEGEQKASATLAGVTELRPQTSALEAQITELWERRSELGPADGDARAVVDEAIGLLEIGRAHV